MPVTDFIETTEALMDHAVDQLDNYEDWTVEKFPGTNEEELFSFIPELSLPCAVVVYSRSDYGNKPRRTVDIGVIVACESFSDSDRVTLRALIDKAVSLLDKQILNQAVFEAVSDEALDIGIGVAAAVVNFKIEDY